MGGVPAARPAPERPWSGWRRRQHDFTCAKFCGYTRDGRRAGGDGGAEEEIVEEHARDPARRVGKVEVVRAMPRHDAAARDVRRVGQRDAECVEDREGVVGEELAAELVAREGVAVD